MHDEMNAHIEQAAERFVARGMPERDALHAARREFGNVAVIQEQARDSRGGRWVDNFTTDVRYAFRYFARTPLVTVTIVFTLMLGVGVSAAGFSLMNAVLFRPPAGIQANSSLVMVRGMQRVFGSPATRLMSLAEVEAYGALPIFEMLSGWRSFDGIADVGSGGAIDAVSATYVLPNYFATLGIRPGAGSAWYPSTGGDTNRVNLTAVIGFQLARERFGGASEAIGKTLHLNDVMVTIVGVAPPKFNGVNGGPRTLYLPISAMRVVENARGPSELSNDSLAFRVVARLRVGVSIKEALASVNAISGRFSRPPDPAMRRVDAGADVVPLRADNQGMFVVAQVAIAQPVLVVLAMVTVLVIHEIRRESDLTSNGSMIVAQFDENSSARIATATAELKNLSDRISGLPGVTRMMPWSEDNGGRTPVGLWSPPGANAAPSARSLRFEFKSVAPEYFDAMDIPMIAGRRFSSNDTSSVIMPIIVYSDFAVKALGSSQVIGSRFCFMSCSDANYGKAMYEIVGVVPASNVDAVDDGRAIKVFRPYLATKLHAWLIKNEQSPTATIASIHRLARQEAPHVPVIRIATIAERNKGKRDVMLQISSAAASGGLITLLLGCVGLYAIVALAVNQRRREIGIRIAMGARAGQVVTQFFKGGLRLSILGLAIGLPLSAAVIRILGNQVGLPKTNTVAIALFIASVVVLVASFAT